MVEGSAPPISAVEAGVSQWATFQKNIDAAAATLRGKMDSLAAFTHDKRRQLLWAAVGGPVAFLGVCAGEAALHPAVAAAADAKPAITTTVTPEATATPTPIRITVEEGVPKPGSGKTEVHVVTATAMAPLTETPPITSTASATGTPDATPTMATRKITVHSGESTDTSNDATDTPVVVATAQKKRETATPSATATVAATEAPHPTHHSEGKNENAKGGEVLQDMPLLTLTHLDPKIAFSPNPDGSFSLEPATYDTLYTIQFPKNMVNITGTNNVEIDLKDFAGMKIHPVSSDTAAAALAIEVPADETERARLDKTMDVSSVMDAMNAIPADALNQAQKKLAADTLTQGFDRALHLYVQTMQTQYRLSNPDVAEQLLRQASAEAFSQNAPQTIVQILNEVAGGNTVPTDIENDILALTKSVPELVKTRGIEVALKEIQYKVGLDFAQIKQRYGEYVPMTESEFAASVNQKLADIVTKVVPDFAKNQTAIPDHLAHAQIMIKGGKLYMPLPVDGKLSFAVDEPDDLTKMQISGHVNGEHPFMINSMRVKSKN